MAQLRLQPRRLLRGLLLGFLLMLATARAQVTEDQKLLGHDGGIDARFGAAVALVETEAEVLALIGAPRDAEVAENAGAVYAYRYDEGAGVWIEEEKLWPEEVGENAIIGRAVALSADGRLAFVSGAEPGSETAPRYGRVHVFRRTDGAWVEEATLAASDETPLNGFGCSVAISADGAVVAVGACQATGPRPGTGAVYIFRSDDGVGTWVEEAKVSTERGCFFTAFGAAVDISAAGDRMVVGEPCGEGGDPPVLYFFHRSGAPDGPDGGWVREAVFGTADEGVGWGDVALSAEGDYALVGTWFEHVAIFERKGTTWTETESITASDGFPGLGDDAIELRGEVALIGNERAAVESSNEGAAYLFRRSPSGVWVEETKLVASDGDDFDSLGRAVALSNRLALVGAPRHGADVPTGATYAFDLMQLLPVEEGGADALVLSTYPNPFVTVLTVSYALPAAAHVRLAVYDVLGRKVKVLADGWRTAAEHRSWLEARHLPPGLYIVRLEAGQQQVTRRAVLLK